MEKAKVYFSDLRTSPTSNLLDKMERLPVGGINLVHT